MEDIHAAANELVKQLQDVQNGDLVAEIVANGLKLLRDRTNRGDIKLIDRAAKEFRYAMKVFAPYRHVRKVSIFGSARTLESHADYRMAAEFGKTMALAGWMVITGAGGGIMAAGHGGAGAEPSFGLNISLPFEQAANEHILDDPKLINFKYFFTRKLMFVRSSHAIALFPGGFGTMDEGFEVLTLIQTGKAVPMPIVMVEPEGSTFWADWQTYVENNLLGRNLISRNDLRLYKVTNSVAEAVEEVRHFYANYHSIRYTRNSAVLRLHREPTQRQCEELNATFADLCGGTADFRASGPLKVERNEPDLRHLPRLVFNFNRRDYGGIRRLIDHLNNLPE